MNFIETSHVGSLPRGPELTPLLLARDHGEPYDAEEFDRVVQAAVEDGVQRQIDAGVSIVSDGELGKVGYSTYIIERLEGFGGHSERKPALDLAPLPELRAKLAAIMGSQEFTRASCIAPVRLQDAGAAARRYQAVQLRAGRNERPRLPQCRIAGPDHRLPAQRALSGPRSLSRRSRDRDAARNMRRSTRPASSSSSIAPIWPCRATPAIRT